MYRYNNKTFTIIFIIFIFFAFSLVGCTPQKVQNKEKYEDPLNKLLNEEIDYSLYSENGFSVLYPEWPNNANGDVELAVSKGYCSIAVNSEKITAKQWYDMMADSVAKQAGEIIISDQGNLHMQYFLDYNNHTLRSDNRFFECQDNTVAITITCLEEFYEIMQKLSDKIYPSVNCDKKEVEFNEYNDGDFSIDYPGWKDTLDGGNERLLGISKGVCSIIVDKHNALPKDVFDWLKKAIEEKEDHDLLTSSTEKNEYGIVYKFPYEDNTLTSTTKIFYCNYNSYVTQVICVDEYFSENDEEIKNSVLDSSRCAKEYEIPTPKKIKEEKQEISEKEPEVIEEIEDEIVKTTAGEEFGIDEEMVVYFINSNLFFTKIMKDFTRVNLLIDDKENGRELKLRVLIDDDGKIKLLEDGEYSNADVTLIVPLRDALNIFNNAANLNPLTLIGFAMNVKTEPPEIKNEVIQKVLRGEYN